jgi:hypothetical protein
VSRETHAGNEPSRGSLAKWQTSPELLPQLAPPQELLGYQYQPPKGYGVASREERGGTQSVIWAGPQRADGSAPKFWVMVGRMAPKEVGMPLPQSCGILIAAAKQTLLGVTETKGEFGEVNGLTFYRMTFEGRERATPVKGHAVVYHAQDGQQYIHVMGIDTEPHHAETRPLFETAARTIRKR